MNVMAVQSYILVFLGKALIHTPLLDVVINNIPLEMCQFKW